MLPRYINENGVVTVRLKRKMEYRNVYRQCNIKPYSVIRALHWLIGNSSFYANSNVTVSRDWLQETMTNLQDSGDLITGTEQQTENNIENNTNCLDVQELSNVSTGITGKATSNDDVVNVDSACDGQKEEENMCQSESEVTQEHEASNDNFSEIDLDETQIQCNSLIERQEDPLYCDIAPGEGRKPIHIAYDAYMEEMCFPTMYCGKTVKEIFHSDITFIQRVRWQLTSADRRAASNAEFIFLCYKKYQLQYVYDKVTFSLRCFKEPKHYKASEVLNQEYCRNIARVDNGYYYFQQLRNSPQYLQERKRELLATVRQKGVPTFFISLSAADTKWESLIRCLGKIVDGKEYSKEEIQNLTFQDKTRLINGDPVTAARFFDRRFHYFLKQILMKPPYPLGKVTQYFYRVEFQHRGSPHIHMLVYCEDCPRYKKNTSNSELIAYLDKYVTCSKKPGQPTESFVHLQTHKHSGTCRKMGKSICRFGFPIPPVKKSIILRPNKNKTDEEKRKYKEIQKYLDSDSITETTTIDEMLTTFNLTYNQYILILRSVFSHDKVYLQRKPCEGRVNMYMRNLLHVWQANMDCQLCIDANSVVNYIVNYINKESRGLSLNLDKVAKECEANNKSVKDTIKALGNVFVNTSEISVQECIYVLLGIPLTYFSIDVIHVPTFPKNKRTKVVKSKKKLSELSENSTDIYIEDKFEQYSNRPKYFENWCMADYLTKVQRQKRSKSSLSKEPTGHFLNRLGRETYNTRTYSYKTHRQKVLSYVCPKLQKDRETYYRIQLLLYHPWRQEICLEGERLTYEKYYLQLSSQQRKFILDKIEKYNVEKIDDLEALYRQFQRNANLCIAGEIDHQNADHLEEGSYDLTEGEFFQPVTASDELGKNLNTSENPILRSENRNIVNKLWPTERFLDHVTELNKRQKLVFNHIMKHVITSDTPCHIFITGGAGVGKTKLLHTLYQGLSRHFSLQANVNADLNSVLRLASTGKAAYLINGTTVHNGLNMKTKQKFRRRSERLTADELNTVRSKLQNLQCVMIDEISMVGSKLFREVDLRLQHIFGNFQPFGGKHILCFGDLYQLPPVRDKWIFENTSKGLEALAGHSWCDNFEIYELTQTM